MLIAVLYRCAKPHLCETNSFVSGVENAEIINNSFYGYNFTLITQTSSILYL